MTGKTLAPETQKYVPGADFLEMEGTSMAIVYKPRKNEAQKDSPEPPKIRRRFNVGALKAAANGFDVIEALNIPSVRGRIECPSGTHNDHDMNRCAVYEGGCHCFSCGYTQDVIGMVRDYYTNIRHEPIDFLSAARLVANTCGGEAMYTINDDGKIPPFPFTREELQICGVYLGDGSEHGERHAKFKSPAELWALSPEAFMAILGPMAYKAADKVQAFIDRLGIGECEDALRSVAMEYKAMALSVALRCGAKRREAEDIYGE